MREFEHTHPVVHAETAQLLRHLGDRSAQAPACTGPCQQGRRPCPAPQACQASDPPPDEADGREHERFAAGVLVAICATTALAALVALVWTG